jgi:hypothetical protein
MPTLTIQSPAPNTTVPHGQPLHVGGIARGAGGAEPVLVDTVTVALDGGQPVEADLTIVKHQSVPTVTYSASVEVPEQPGTHTVRVVATCDNLTTATGTVQVLRDVTVVVPAPAVLIDLEPPAPVAVDDITVLELVGAVQRAVAARAGALAGLGVVLAGPNVLATTDAAGIPILRLGLWLVDPAFPVVPPAPPQFPLPRLTPSQAEAGFALVSALPRGHRVGFTDTPFGLRIPVATLQRLVDLGVAKARNDSVEFVRVTATPPATVTTRVHGSFLGVGFDVDVTETLSVGPVPGADPEQSVPHVDVQHSSALGDLLTWLLGALVPILDVILLVGSIELGDATDQIPGVVSALTGDLPARVPIRNTSLPPQARPQFTFPQIVLDWTAFGVEADGVVGAGRALLVDRDPAAARLAIGGPGSLQIPAGELDVSVVYNLALSGVRPDPGRLSWTLNGPHASADSGTVEPDALAAHADLPLDFVLPQAVNAAVFTAETIAVETCGTDPTRTISVSASKSINVRRAASHAPV